MTKSIVVTKEEIIKAIETEPLLSSGQWIGLDNHGQICKVCAVGAVLRSKKLDFYDILSYGDNLCYNNREDIGELANKKEVESLLKKKRYMAALSAFYESAAEDNKYKKEEGKTITHYQHERQQTVRFVKRYFPETLKIMLGE